MTPKPDIRIENHGTLLLFQPLGAAVEAFLHEVAGDDAQWFGRALVVEPRYAQNLVEALQDDGYTVEEAR